MQRSNCPISCTLDIIGDKWTLVIVRDALFKNFTTFGEFQSSPEKIASNILTARLQKMTENGIFTKEGDPSNKLRIHYRLTEKGKSLRTVLLAVGLWGTEHIEGTSDILKKIS